MRTLRTKRRIEFSLPLRLQTNGKEQKIKGIYATLYANIVGMTIRGAALEAGWEKVPKDKGVYMVVTIYTQPTRRNSVEERTEKLENDTRFVIKTPSIPYFADLLVSKMTDVLFERPEQVASLLVVKKFSESERIEVLVGAPESFEGMLYDLRNA